MGKLITGKLGNDHVNSEDIGLFQACIGGEGTYVMTGCECTMSSANNLHISKGALLVQGRFYIVDAAGEDIAIKNGSQGVKRNDLVVLRYTKDSSNQNIENMEFIVVDGVPVAGDPVDPEIAGGDILANDSSIVEIAFCRIQLDGISVGEPVMLFDSLPPLRQAWDSISQTVLYDNPSGTTGAITLPEDLSTFSRLMIQAIAKDHSGMSGRVKSTCETVLDPDGKVAVLSVIQRGAATTGQIIVRSVVLSGTTISNDDSWYANIGANQTVGSLSAVYITKVIGWN